MFFSPICLILVVEKQRVMRRIQLNENEVQVLEKIAKRSKMDDWFKVEETNLVKERDINDLIDGVTDYDVSTLDPEEVETLCKTLIKCNKIKR